MGFNWQEFLEISNISMDFKPDLGDQVETLKTMEPFYASALTVLVLSFSY